MHDSLMRFDHFMDRALHDPEKGYYARKITGVGRRGDFTTAPTLSESLGRAIAAWANRAMKECGVRNLIEMGPGEGLLSNSVMKHLPWYTRLKTRLHLVETSQPLELLQRKHLGNRAIWHKTPLDALNACNGDAVIFSNELVDAFPVRRFEQTELGWKELAVQLRPSLTEVLLDSIALPESSSFQQSYPLGQRIEVHESYRHWLETWMSQWRRGRLLTIDYGSEVDHLYHRRPLGTTRAYLLHQRIEGMGIYQNIGRQDLTADVNFTDLIAWSQNWTKDHKLQSFEQFLKPFTSPTLLADDFLMSEGGAGKAFLVLDQKRIEM